MIISGLDIVDRIGNIVQLYSQELIYFVADTFHYYYVAERNIVTPPPKKGFVSYIVQLKNRKYRYRGNFFCFSCKIHQFLQLW